MTKIVANRANAQHSTGPKDTTKTRFNGVRHGLTSKQTVIPGESQEEYDEYQAAFLRDLNPQSAIERMLADRTIAAAWRLQRFYRMEAAYFDDRVNAYLEDNPEADPDSALAFLFIDKAEIAKTRLFLRYQTTVQREFDKAFSEFRKARAEHEKQLLEEAVRQAARERQVPQNQVPQNQVPQNQVPQNQARQNPLPQKTMTAAAGGFASQSAANLDGINEKNFTIQSQSATLTPCSSASQL